MPIDGLVEVKGSYTVKLINEVKHNRFILGIFSNIYEVVW